MKRGAARSRVPVNLIAGPLGVGKTTTINHLLGQRPASQRWAVLVNEYGLVGLDGALLEGTQGAAQDDAQPGVEVREVAGGCICCSAAMMFEVALVRLLRLRPDRLLIEPTGLAAASGILETLARKGIREAVDVRSVVCILDPAQLERSLDRAEIRDQIDAADVLVAGRSDLASPAQLERFNAWAAELYPAKAWVEHVRRGMLSTARLDLVADREAREPPPTRDGQHHLAHEHHDPSPDAREAMPGNETRPIVRRIHASGPAPTMGWICRPTLVFNADLALSWLRQLSSLPGARRTKAVLHTTRGWRAYNLAGGTEDVRSSGYRRDSRIEVIVEGVSLPEIDAVEHDLRACLC